MYEKNPLLASKHSAIGWLDAELDALKSESNGKIIELIKTFEQESYVYSAMTELDVSYGVLSGYIECSSNLKAINDDDYDKFLKISRSLYMAAQGRISSELTHAAFIYREENGIKALNALLERNLNEHGSGAGTVKRVLLGLYNSDDYPFRLTDLRNLDSENFDDVIAVLQMNARSCPRHEVHNYFQNGDEIWNQMKKGIKRSHKKS